MSIICQLCSKSFEKIISSTHLKFVHKISSTDYKLKFGKHSLASESYRLQRSAERAGSNNPMYGKTHSDNTKKSISKKNSGKIPHNKNKKITDINQLAKIKESIELREENYKLNNNHPKKGTHISDKTKEKISASVKKYAEENSNELKNRAQKILQTKRDNSYFENIKIKTKEKYMKDWNNVNYEIIQVDENFNSAIKHNKCGNIFSRNLKSEFNEFFCSTCYEKQGVSQAELELRQWLQSVYHDEIIFNDRILLNGIFELDFVFRKLQIAIEYNGLYWHSEAAGKSKWYHAKKKTECEKKSYRLIQIFEDEWLHKKDIVKNRLLHILKIQMNNKIHGRLCEVQQISSADARHWHNSHHIQGYSTSKICYGLFYNKELKAVMDFSKLNISKGSKAKDGVWELARFSIDGNIPGGANKLLSKFVKDYDPDEIISYSDCRWNTGALYEKLGFIKIGTTTPNYWYINGSYREHRYKYRKSELVKQGFDKNLSEFEIMNARKIYRIWDAGNDKFVWNKKGS